MNLIPQSQAEDIDLALDAAHEAAAKWGKTSVAERSGILLKIADRIEANLETLAYVEERRKITPPGGNRIDSFSMPTTSVSVWADISRWARSAASRLRSGLEKAQKG